MDPRFFSFALNAEISYCERCPFDIFSPSELRKWLDDLANEENQ
jgi:hypothetical protein